MIYIMEGYSLSLVCTSEKAIKNFEEKGDVQKGALKFSEKIDSRCVSFIQFTFTIVAIW
jgi:hypothetical protein